MSVNQLLELFQQLLPASLAAAVRTQADVIYVCVCVCICMYADSLVGWHFSFDWALTSVDSASLSAVANSREKKTKEGKRMQMAR